MALKQLRLAQIGLAHHRRSREKCALKRDSLHAELQFRIVGFFARDLESVQIEHANFVLDNDALEAFRELLPRLLPDVSCALCRMNTPPFFKPARGFECWNTFGSGESTTST